MILTYTDTLLDSIAHTMDTGTIDDNHRYYDRDNSLN